MKWPPLDPIKVVTASDWAKTFRWGYYTIKYYINSSVWALVGKLSQVWHLPSYITH
jgi:hypothetical protein